MASLFLCIFFIISASTTTTTTAAASCRCLPSQPCWPDAAKWAALNATLEGSLISTSPLASACHNPNYNAKACEDLKSKWSDPFWRADHPSALQFPNFEMLGSKGCSIGGDQRTPCNQGAVPLYMVSVTKPSHVQAAVAFASEHDIRLVVKNTGHDMSGRNTAPGSLGLWMHNLKGITFIKHFTPAGSWFPCGKVAAVRVGAGVQWEELYKAAFKHGRTVVGAQCTSVGAAGGYVLGGGHSQLSPSFGLAADNVLEFEVVTAAGELITANSWQNQHLFWALRGGGGGTFGVVISVTYATHPALTGLVFASYTLSAATTTAFKKFLTEFLALSPYLSDAGWGGNFFWGGNTTLVLQYLLPNKDLGFANQTLGSLFASIRQSEIKAVGGLQLYPSYYEWHRAVQCSNGKCGYPSGSTALEASRLIPRTTLQSSPFQLAAALMNIHEQGYQRVSGYLVGGGKVSQPRFNSVNPAWRSATLHVLVAGYYPDFTTMDAKASKETKTTNDMKVLRDLTPESGTYLNEADMNEPDWTQSFFGPHYSLLKYIKKMVDPKGVFACRNCVGSDDWNADLSCRLNGPESYIASS